MPVDQGNIGNDDVSQELVDAGLLDDDALVDEPVTSGGDTSLWEEEKEDEEEEEEESEDAGAGGENGAPSEGDGA